MERVTVTLPADLLRDVDRWNKNRSKFVAEAVRNELEHRRRAELRLSLQNPHPDAESLADEGLADWAGRLPDEDTNALFDSTAGKAVRWVPDVGWTERAE